MTRHQGEIPIREALTEFRAIHEELDGLETVEQQAELMILCRGGVTRRDYDFAVRSMARSRRLIGERWGYLRTVMLAHRAERLADEMLAWREAQR